MPLAPRIDFYAFGQIEIDGQVYTSDVIILPSGVQDEWWRQEGHNVTPSDLDTILEAGPQSLIIGQGAHGGMKVSDESVDPVQPASIARRSSMGRYLVFVSAERGP